MPQQTLPEGLSPLRQLPDLIVLVKLNNPESPQQVQAVLLICVGCWQYKLEFHQSLGGGGIRL